MLGTQVIIERDAKEVAVLTPKEKPGFDREALLKASEKVRGIFKDYDPKRDSPFYGKNAWPNLGKWDKGIKWAKKRV